MNSISLTYKIILLSYYHAYKQNLRSENPDLSFPICLASPVWPRHSSHNLNNNATVIHKAAQDPAVYYIIVLNPQQHYQQNLISSHTLAINFKWFLKRNKICLHQISYQDSANIYHQYFTFSTLNWNLIKTW